MAIPPACCLYRPTACIQAGLPTLLATVEGNMQTILADLRATGFAGAIVITNY
jgi:hypothetical protein